MEMIWGPAVVFHSSPWATLRWFVVFYSSSKKYIMNNELIIALSHIDECDFLELISALNIAKYARSIMKNFQVPESDMIEKLSIDKEKLHAILWGYYPFDLRMMSKLEAINSALQVREAKDTASKILEFPDYKDSVPVKYMVQFAKLIRKELMPPNEPNDDNLKT